MVNITDFILTNEICELFIKTDMNRVLKMMNIVLNMMNCVLKMMN